MVKPIPPKNISDTWPATNYADPEIRSHGALLAATVTLTTLMMAVVSMRLYVRLIMLHTLSWDDFFIAVAAIFSVGICTTINMSMNAGWDRHIWDQQPQWFQLSELYNWLIQNQYVVLITCAKVSALCTYLRVSPAPRLRIFIKITLGLVSTFGIGFFLATFFECHPVHLYWTSIDGVGCTDEDSRLMAGTIIIIITDLLVVFIPVPIIKSLQIPLRDKLVLGFLMCMGFFATIASIVRTVVMAESMTTFQYDMTWNGFYVWLWLAVEINFAIMCISVPILRPLVRRVAPCLSGSLNTRGRGTINTSFASGSMAKGMNNSNSRSKAEAQNFSDRDTLDGSKYHEYLEKANNQYMVGDDESPRAAWTAPQQWDVESAGDMDVVPQEDVENVAIGAETVAKPKSGTMSWLQT